MGGCSGRAFYVCRPFLCGVSIFVLCGCLDFVRLFADSAWLPWWCLVFGTCLRVRLGELVGFGGFGLIVGCERCFRWCCLVLWRLVVFCG